MAIVRVIRKKKSKSSRLSLKSKSKLDTFDDIFPSDGDDIDNIMNITSYPWHFWFMAVVFFVGGSILIYFMSTGQFRKILMAKTGDFEWQYLLASIFYLIGIVFLLVGSIETIVLNREDDTVVMTKFRLHHYICGSFKEVKHRLSSIVDVTAECRGHVQIDMDTRYYKIILVFKDQNKMRVLEASSERAAIMTIRRIRLFLSHGSDETQSNENSSSETENVSSTKSNSTKILNDAAILRHLAEGNQLEK